METVRLRVVGITYTQIESGMYALVMEEEGGSLRFPIIIGYSEAQSIECAMQKRELPRPLPHDTIGTVLRSFDIQLESVMIRLNENGIFTADLRLERNGETHVIDSRSSDAIAIAIRLGAPILTTRELLEKSGMDKDSLDVKVMNRGRPYPTPSEGSGFNRISEVLNASKGVEEPKEGNAKANSLGNPLKNMSQSTLQRMMERAVDSENYEKAARIKDELDRRSHP